jgi:diphosphoinositol-polyphosphate diphosphatase
LCSLDCGLRYSSPSINGNVQLSTGTTSEEKIREEKSREDADAGWQKGKHRTEPYDGGRNGSSSLGSTTEAEERSEIEHFRRIQIKLAEPPWDDFGQISHFNPLNPQRYSAKGERIVAGVVALSADKSNVLIIRSVRRSGWVLPKGQWRSAGRTPSRVAIRKAWEEAGVVVTLVRYLGSITDHSYEGTTARGLNSEKELYCFYEAKVESQHALFPQADVRYPSWVSYATAQKIFSQRPEFMEALNRSSIQKSAGRRNLSREMQWSSGEERIDGTS